MSKSKEYEEVEVEALVPLEGMQAVMKAEIDVQIATAKSYPRSLAQFRKRATEMVTMDKETAESCIYNRPVGKKDGRTEYASGESIRMAEIVAASYGNIRHGATIVEQTPRRVVCRGVAHDLESNNFSSSEVVGTTVTKAGQPFSEGMRAVVAKATLAKAQRDAIFKVVPKALCKTITDAARQTILGEHTTMDERRAAAKKWTDGMDIPEKRVFHALGVKGWDDIGEDEFVTLTGIRTAIKNNDITPKEAFPVAQETQAPSEKLADVQNAGKTEPDPEPEKKEPVAKKEKPPAEEPKPEPAPEPEPPADSYEIKPFDQMTKDEMITYLRMIHDQRITDDQRVDFLAMGMGHLGDGEWFDKPEEYSITKLQALCNDVAAEYE